MAIRVESYKAFDGKLFESLDEAHKYEKTDLFNNLVMKIYYSATDRAQARALHSYGVAFPDLLLAMKENKEELLKTLNFLKDR